MQKINKNQPNHIDNKSFFVKNNCIKKLIIKIEYLTKYTLIRVIYEII